MKKVIKLDKIKIVVNEEYITNINEDVFTTIIKNGQIVEYRYEQQYPYLLYIEKDLIEHELVIEFSGKILEDKYPMLINKDTIEICLENINKLAICHINVPEILLKAICIGSVFFGAMTYIGNGPNFMVKAIAEQEQVRMPSFFGYIALSISVLLPVYALVEYFVK